MKIIEAGNNERDFETNVIYWSKSAYVLTNAGKIKAIGVPEVPSLCFAITLNNGGRVREKYYPHNRAYIYYRGAAVSKTYYENY